MKSTAILLVLVLTAVSVSVGTATVASPHGAETGVERVFYADDADPEADRQTSVGQLTVRELTRGNAELRTLARTYDFYYLSPAATTAVGESGLTLTDVRQSAIASVTRTDQQSVWPATAPAPTDGRFLADVTVAFTGIEDGGRARAPKTGLNSTYLLPESGTVYSFADYRLDLPERQCEYEYDFNVSGGISGGLLDTTKRCTSFEVTDTTTTRTLSIGDQSWRSDGTDRTLEYEDATADGTVALELEFEVELTVEATVQTYEYNETRAQWVHQTTNSRTLTEEVVASDSRQALVTTNQRLHVHQTVIEQGNGRYRLLLDFQGPEALVERRLWAQASIGDSHVLTGPWRAFSQRRFTRAVATSNANPNQRPTHLPHPFSVEIVPTDGVAVVERTGASPSPANPTVTATTTPVSDTAPTLRDTVNLSVSNPVVVQRVEVQGAPAPVSGVRDLHGESIPLTTETIPFREPTLRIRHVNETHAKIELVDPATGDPLGGKQLYLTGADSQTIRTTQSGTAVVAVDGRLLSVEYRGSGDETVGEVYYGRTSATSAVSGAGGDIVEQVVDDLQTMLVSGWGPFVLAWAIAVYAFRHR